VLRRTRSVVFVRGLLTAGDTLVATANGVWKLLSGPPR
jgi:acyl-coenzyme A thioesterase PaaI-like protein